MTRTIKAHELGDEHIGARIHYTVNGWAVEGELAQVKGVTSYLSYLQAAGGLGSLTVGNNADVTILEEAPPRHPDEPTGLGAVVEADIGEAKPARWLSVVDITGRVRWVRSGAGIGMWYTWVEIQEDAIAPIRVLSEGVHPDEPVTPEVYSGMVITEWPENDEHLREWVIEDDGGDEWLWEIREGDVPGLHWRWAGRGYSEPINSPVKVLKKVSS